MFFSIEPLSFGTGYWQCACHGWFHLHKSGAFFMKEWSKGSSYSASDDLYFLMQLSIYTYYIIDMYMYTPFVNTGNVFGFPFNQSMIFCHMTIWSLIYFSSCAFQMPASVSILMITWSPKEKGISGKESIAHQNATKPVQHHCIKATDSCGGLLYFGTERQ